MKLGSLFDGSGGFPLAGVLNGITPVWASEIEPYPIAVTSARFPSMKHLGSITEINGGNIEPVDIVTFGSPCQDLSIAGNQKGIENGARSSLFFQAIRIIKEMRDATNGVYPNYAVWENVPGAFSSNKGNDFRLVLEALASISEPEVSIPVSEKWQRAGEIVGDGWSIAWRTLDAQYWGVPQRRKRIYLIADFGSERAGEILFEQEGVRGDSAESGTARQSAAGDAEGSVRGSCVAWTYRGRENGCNIECQEEVAYALRNPLGGGSNANVCYAAAFKYGNSAQAHGIGWQEEISPTLQAGEGGNQKPVVCYALQGNGIDRADTAGCNGCGWRENECYTLNTIDRPAVAYSVDCRNMNLTKEHGTLHAGQSLNYMGAVCYALDRYNGEVTGDVTQTLAGLERMCNAPHVCYPIDSHQQDSRFKVCADGISPTLPGQMGTGGNNGPMVLETFQNTGRGWWNKSDIAQTVRTPCGGDSTKANLVITKTPRKYIIRRLTPLECCRLQGFPDWWEDGVQGSDSAQYKMWGNGIALPCAVFVLGQIAGQIERSEPNG